MKTELAQLRINLENDLRLEQKIRDYVNAWRRELSKISRSRARTQRQIKDMLAASASPNETSK